MNPSQIQDLLKRKQAEIAQKFATFRNPIRPAPVVENPDLAIDIVYPAPNSVETPSYRPSGKGLNIAPHPLLLNPVEYKSGRKKVTTIQASETAAAKAAHAASLAAKAAKEAKVMESKPVEFVNPYLINDFKKGPRPKARKVREFQFVKEGRYLAQGEKLRTEARLEVLKQKIADTAKKAGIEKTLDLVADTGIRREEPPLVEWWDATLLDGSYDSYNPQITTNKTRELISNLIQHPIPIHPQDADSKAKLRALMLTQKEQKKFRKQKRLEAQKDKQDQIRLGMLPPEQPKVKISNLMRVLGQEAVLDPTQIETKVREQMADRIEKHLEHNASGKLTEQEKRDKLRRQLKENTKDMVSVAVFMIKDFSHGQHRFKVDKNAQQYNLTGVGLCYSGMNLIIAEGGPVGMKKYKTLLTRRIDWNHRPTKPIDSDPIPENENPQDPEGEKEPNECQLVWEGQVQHRNFRNFRIKVFPTETAIKAYLQDFDAVHYWFFKFSLGIQPGILSRLPIKSFSG